MCACSRRAGPTCIHTLCKSASVTDSGRRRLRMSVCLTPFDEEIIVALDPLLLRRYIGLYDNWAFQPISRFRGREELACFPASFVVVSCVMHHDAPTALRLLTAHLLRICCAPFLNSLPRLLFSYYCLAIAAARFCAYPPAGVSAAGVLPTCGCYCPFVALLVYYATRL